ncbi:MAG: adenine deaminase [Verrucomicrobiota bacterium]
MDSFSGRIVDVENQRIFGGTITIREAKIDSVVEDPTIDGGPIYSPGLVDAHVHIESSLLSPSAFASAAVVHGTVATVSDPHEIANVCGIEGVDWMIRSAAETPVQISFGAPSCVPATPFETAGAHFGAKEIGSLLDKPEVSYLAEVMNFPAVIAQDPDLMAIIKEASKRCLPIDGHAPGVTGKDLLAYASAGIETDHECVTLEEAKDRISVGMKVAIREGSAARNFDALWPIIKDEPDSCFFCSDDKHPDDLIVSHVDGLVRRAVRNGIDPITAIQVASLNPARHYGLGVGLLRPGDSADFIEVEELEDFRPKRTWIKGELVAEDGLSLLSPSQLPPVNRFEVSPLSLDSIRMPLVPGKSFATIVAEDGQLITGSDSVIPTAKEGLVVSDPSRDLLKIVVVNRYGNTPPAVGLIRNFGLKTGAIAGSVAHDSHNIVAVGADDHVLVKAINAIITCKGGLSFASRETLACLPLPVAGLISEKEAPEAAREFTHLTSLAKEDGCRLGSPYMTLSFMSLLVIPSLKIGDRGHFDVNSFTLIDPWQSK